MKDKSKDNIIRIRDTIKIISPNFFVRCGYPLDIKEVTQQMSKKYYKEIKNFVYSIIDFKTSHNELCDMFDLKPLNQEKEFEDIAKCLAYRYIKEHNFGGKEKEIYTNSITNLENKLGIVIDVRSIFTGTYYPASSGYDSYTGESDWEPGGLANSKYHKILTIRFPKINTNEYRIEDIYVEKIKDPELTFKNLLLPMKEKYQKSNFDS